MMELQEILRQQIDTLWVLISAILVFIMQAGFMCLEAGLSRKKNNINVALKNIADFGVSVSVFWALGFGVMFGTSMHGLFGTDSFFFVSDIAPQLFVILHNQMLNLQSVRRRRRETC